MTCIDLRDRFGAKYKIDRDPAYQAQYGRRVVDPWYDLIVCRHGVIFPQGGQLLAASTTKNGPIANQLRSADFCRVVQDGDDGVTVVFDVEQFSKVAAVMRPRRAKRSTGAELTILQAGRRKLARKPLGKAPKSTQETPLGC